MNFNKILFCFLVLGYPTGAIAEGLPLLNTSPHEISVTAEARAYLNSDSCAIKVQLESSGASAVNAEKAILAEIEKIRKIKDVNLVVGDRDFQGSTSNPKEIVKGVPLKLVTTLTVTSKDLNQVALLIDQILATQGSKIISINYFASGNNESLKVAYAQAVSNAKAKAEFLSKNNNLNLGEIIEVNMVEDLPPSSIRDQLESGSGDVNSGPFESRVVATVRFALR